MSVVPMMKTTILAHIQDIEEVMEALQFAGMMHLSPIHTREHQLRMGPNATLELYHTLERAAHALYSVAPAAARRHDDSLSEREVLNKVMHLLEEREHLEEKLLKVKTDMEILKPWGDFCPDDVKRIREKGVSVTFATITREEWHLLNKKRLTYAVSHEDEGLLWVCLFDADKLPITSLRLPPFRLSHLVEERDRLQREIAEIRREMGRYAHFGPLLRAKMDALQDQVDLLRAFQGTRVDLPVVALQGYVPASRTLEVQGVLADFDVGYRIEEPGENDHVPVLLENNRFFSGFESILKTFSGLNYREKDVTWMVGLLFILFGSLCLLDAGYGLLLLITGLVLKFMGHRDFGKVFLITGLFSVPVGLLSGQAFGFIMGQHVYLDRQPLLPLAADPLSCFVFSLMVGGAAMGFGYGISIWQNGLKTHALGSLLLICALCMFVLTHQGVAILQFTGLDPEQLAQFGSMGSGGLLLLALISWLLFPEPVFGKGAHGANVVWTLYSGSTGLVQDILSHMRLFGIALSGSILALVVNRIGALFPLPVAILFAIVGHAFVYALALLSLYIHSNRLIFLEVGSKCIEGGNHYYRPFRRGFSL